MARILGVDIPSSKKIEYALRYIYGIGPTRSKIVLEAASIDPNVRAHELSEEDYNKIVSVIEEKGYLVEGDARRKKLSDIKRLQAIRCDRGIRHQRSLPVRGQRTKTNARTRKGNKRGPAVVKKK